MLGHFAVECARVAREFVRLAEVTVQVGASVEMIGALPTAVEQGSGGQSNKA